MALPHEEKPLGLQVPPVTAGVEIPPEPPDVGARALSVASRLLAGATTFFFLSFVFAYFYLRSLNVEHMFKPNHVKPVQGLGIIFVIGIVLSAGCAFLAGRQGKAGNRDAESERPLTMVFSLDWPTWALFSVMLGLGAVAVQCIEFTQQKFGPTDGSYASIFVGWMSFYMIAVLATMYWLETHVATEWRARRRPAPRAEGDIKEADRLIAPGLDAAVFYWCFLAAIGVLAYVVLYLL